jgi:hypothetical protein
LVGALEVFGLLVPAGSTRRWKEEVPALKWVPGGEGGAVQEQALDACGRAGKKGPCCRWRGLVGEGGWKIAEGDAPAGWLEGTVQGGAVMASRCLQALVGARVLEWVPGGEGGAVQRLRVPVAARVRRGRCLQATEKHWWCGCMSRCQRTAVGRSLVGEGRRWRRVRFQEGGRGSGEGT